MSFSMAYTASLLPNFTFPQQEDHIQGRGRAPPQQTTKKLVSTHNNFTPTDSQIK